MISQYLLLLLSTLIASATSTGDIISSKSDDGRILYHTTEADPCVIATPDGVIDLSALEKKQFSVTLDVYQSLFYWVIGWCKKQVDSAPIGPDGQPMQNCDSTQLPAYITQHSSALSLCEFSMYNWLSGITAEKANDVWVVSYSADQPGTYRSIAYISLECSPTTPEQVDCKKNSPSDPCIVKFQTGDVRSYTAAFVSPYACPGHGSGGGGGGGCGFSCAFLLIFFLGGFVYLVSFMAYNYKFKELRGRELLPHQEFWKSIPGLCKDGAIFLFMKIKGCFARS
eukprot:TRINITY_DN7363_c0_g2_i3.p1 TRINITY_DN7363_c0_g2~~TRINITY_DN7363_c0_g2_i3.p1  ORF type:complete len:283 (+),score=55.07 TRINITY_DN7363_c0_g2_i3:108-956(+)